MLYVIVKCRSFVKVLMKAHSCAEKSFDMERKAERYCADGTFPILQHEHLDRIEY
jgi:hypothetical protein